MANETIMLSKTYKKPSNLIFPLRMSEKIDGVPGDFYYKRELGRIHARTRQGEEIHSADHIIAALHKRLIHGAHIIGELYIPGWDFKDISGVVRRDNMDADTIKLTLRIFDYYVEGYEDQDYASRLVECATALHGLPSGTVRIIPGQRADDLDEFTHKLDLFKLHNPDSEGIVMRALHGPKSVWKAAWRSPGMLKLKWTETIDLPIESIEEAVSKDGEPLGMVGRINVRYNGKVSGIGPGKMKHEERIHVWKNREQYRGRMVEAAYMPDDSYEGLREGRFWRFRPDKDAV